MSPRPLYLWVSTHIVFSLLLSGSMVAPATAAPVASVTLIRSTPNPAVEGQTVTFTAGVNFTANQFATGTITLTDTYLGSPMVLGTITLDPTTGAGTFATSALATGLHNVVAVYSGDANYLPGSSAALQQTIVSAFTATTTTLSSTVNPAAVGQSVTFNASITASKPSTMRPTGTVTFYDGTTDIGSAPVINEAGTKTLNSASISTTMLASGSHNIQAVYSGDGVFAGSTSAVVVQVVQGSVSATTTTLTASTTSSTAGQPITFTVGVTSGASGPEPTGTVTINDGTSLLAQVSLDTNGHATYTTSSPSAGTHALTATYGGDSNYGPSAAAPLSVVVTASQLAATTTTLASSVNPSTVGSSITLTASVATASGTPTGTVTFQDGSVTLGSNVALQNGLATLSSVSLTAVGAHILSATYSGDSVNAGSSGTLTQVVNPAQATPTTTSLSSSANPSINGDPITFTATVSGNGGIPSGQVIFTVGSSVSSVGLDATGTAVFSTAALPVGITPVSAAYAGNATFGSSVSPQISQTVDAARASFSANPNPIPVSSGTTVGVTTLSWNAAQAQTVEIHVGSPTGPLFAAGGSSGSAQTGPWVSEGMTFYLQDTTGGNALTAVNTLAILEVHVVQPGLWANPNPILVGLGAKVGSTLLLWNAPSAQTVEVHIGSPSGALFAEGGSSGSAPTGPWVSDGLTFYLQDTTGGKALNAANTISTLVVHLQSTVPLIANPNPIPVPMGISLGTTTIYWYAPSSSQVQVHVGAPDGALFAAGGPIGSSKTGPWVANGTTFYLQDVSGGKPLTGANTLGVVVAQLTSQ
jgi:Bacterial Ig-like domain (group 3)